MSCFLCGHEKTGSHHLGCAVIFKSDLTVEEAVALGLVAPPAEPEGPSESVVEILVDGKSDSVPATPEQKNEILEAKLATLCEHGTCHNPKYSDHPRVKFCEDHKDPKNRKE